jgi:hypothetical protein
VPKMTRLTATAAAAGMIAVGVASPAQAAPTVQALWNMDSVPTMVDSAGGDNNGTTSAITMNGGFYAFDGANSIAQVPHKANLNPGTANIEVEARINAATAPAPGETYDIVRKGTSGTAGGYYKIELRGKTGGGINVACIFKDGNRIAGRAVVAFPVGTWQTITCTKTATTVTLTTGATTRTTSGSVGAIANTAPVHVGGKGDGTDVFSGLMDHASITIG